MSRKNFKIIKGVDGKYVVKAGQLVKITSTEKSPFGGSGDRNMWIKHTLEDGDVLRIDKSVDIDLN